MKKVIAVMALLPLLALVAALAYELLFVNKLTQGLIIFFACLAVTISLADWGFETLMDGDDK